MRDSTATTTVLSIFSLTTRPWRTLRRPRSCSAPAVGLSTCSILDLSLGQLALPDVRQDAGDLLPPLADGLRVVQVPRRVTDAVLEQLLPGFPQLALQFHHAEVPERIALFLPTHCPEPPLPARGRLPPAP